MLTIDPPPRAIIVGIAYLQQRNVPRALTANTSSQTSSGVSGALVVEPMPATLTSTSTSCATAATCASSRTSRWTWVPVRSAATTSAPSVSNRRATAAPMPDPAPVMSARLPAKRVIPSSSRTRLSRGRDEHSAIRRGRHERPVAREHTHVVARGRGTPSDQALCQLAVVELHEERALVNVDRDDITVLNNRKRSAACRLRRDVPDHQPAGRARKSAVGDEYDGLADAGSDHGRRDAQHLAHT